MTPTVQDRLAAYRLLIDALPRATDFAVRCDGSSMAGVFAVVDQLRMEYQGCIGELADGDAVNPGGVALQGSGVNATPHDTSSAYQLVIDCLPRSTEWQNGLGARSDGSTPAGIFAALDEVRMELHIRIGDLMDEQILGTNDHAHC